MSPKRVKELAARLGGGAGPRVAGNPSRSMKWNSGNYWIFPRKEEARRKMAIPADQLERWSHQGSVTQCKQTYATVKNALEAPGAPYTDRHFKVFL
jgi:hypothetical protein